MIARLIPSITSNRRTALVVGTLLVAMFCSGPGNAQSGDAIVLAPSVMDRLTLKPTHKQVTTQAGADGVAVTVEAGESGYPGVQVKPADGTPWNLADFGHLEARVTNTGTQPIYLSLRVDNAGHHSGQPWNTESRAIKPGQTDTVKVMFGYAYGFKPSFKLDASKITSLLVFTGKAESPVSYRIESITAGGAPGEKPVVNPAHVGVKPKDGVILGADTKLDTDIKTTIAGGKAQVVGQSIEVAFPPSGSEQRVAIRPRTGVWNLSEHLQVEVRIKNVGDTPITPRVRLDSNKGDSEWAVSDKAIAPGESHTIAVPFRSENTWQGPQSLESEPFKGEGGSQLASNIVGAVSVSADPTDVARLFQVESIRAGLTPAPVLPDWLGKRPPVEGDWSVTFEDNFDGDAIDLGRWNIYTSNFWDKKSHFSKDNVLVGDGKVTLRFEKKTGPHNDEPGAKVTDYATGYLGTYGKWVQRYGYFESRMKLPTAAGMWPAFWLMPDRGEEVGPQWKRANTAEGAMEFDIMEHLSRWGPNRHTVAFHWDGYGKDHKVTGTAIYMRPDEEGYITSGLLWLPGVAVVYCNGVEVARWENPRISDVESYIIYTAVSGGWDNDPIDDATLPGDFIIDYVRVWQRADLASDVDGYVEP